ncbi:MAG TPA: hypothetical protein VF491_26300, partial [Vicinamibacterales bacterium]
TVHEQPVPVVTANDALPPPPAMLNVVVEMAKEQVVLTGGVVVVGDVGVFEHATTPIVRINATFHALNTCSLHDREYRRLALHSS